MLAEDDDPSIVLVEAVRVKVVCENVATENKTVVKSKIYFFKMKIITGIR